MKVLVTGWFSFDCGHATAGDLLARNVVCAWLDEAGCKYDVAVVPPFEGDLEWIAAVPTDYEAVIFVCGPFRPGWPITEYLDLFAGRKLIGINVSMLEPLDRWNPFDLLFERDSDSNCRPDLAYLSRTTHSPVVGLTLVHPQSEYGERQRHGIVNDAIHRLLRSRDVAVVPIDTRLDQNSVGLSSSGQVEGLIAKMDVVVTTRLHGLVLALKNGVPALAIDPIAGGAKIKPQAEVIGWPAFFTVETLDDETLSSAFDFCLSPEGRALARQCGNRAASMIRGIRDPLIRGIVGEQAMRTEPTRVR